MDSQGLGLVVALREECRLILGWDGWVRPETHPDFPVFERGERGRRVRLVISGMGGTRAIAGLQVLLHGFCPSRVVSLGYGGALDPRLGVGDLIWGKRVFQWEDTRGEVTPGRELSSPPMEILEGSAGGSSGRLGYLVSVNGLVEKQRVLRGLAPELAPAVLEMETHALSQAVEEMGLPLVGLRAVSDELGFEISPIVSKWTDETLRMRAPRLVNDLLRHPWRIGFLVRLSFRSRKASRSLSRALRLLLNHLD